MFQDMFKAIIMPFKGYLFRMRLRIKACLMPFKGHCLGVPLNRPLQKDRDPLRKPKKGTALKRTHEMDPYMFPIVPNVFP